MNVEKILQELIRRLKIAAGSNLESVVLHGSAVTGEFHPSYSDLNVLCVFRNLGLDELSGISSVVTWWTRGGHPAPLLFTEEELHHSADVFAIEMLDIKANHRILDGKDLFTDLHVSMEFHCVQVEHELRTNVIRLRQGYLAQGRNRTSLLRLMADSVSTFIALFRHALILFGKEVPKSKREVLSSITALLDLDPAPFHALLDVRERKRSEGELDVFGTFREYLAMVTRVADEVDRRISGPQAAVRS